MLVIMDPLSEHVRRLQSFLIRSLWIILEILVWEKRRHTEVSELGRMEIIWILY